MTSKAEITKGQIFDVFEEGFPTFRACALENENHHGIVRVVDLYNGQTLYVASEDTEPAIIESVFEVQS